MTRCLGAISAQERLAETRTLRFGLWSLVTVDSLKFSGCRFWGSDSEVQTVSFRLWASDCEVHTPNFRLQSSASELQSLLRMKSAHWAFRGHSPVEKVLPPWKAPKTKGESWFTVVNFIISVAVEMSSTVWSVLGYKSYQWSKRPPGNSCRRETAGCRSGNVQWQCSGSHLQVEAFK